MSEHNLWVRIRDKIAYSGHFVRMEFNPEAGIPDVDYCIRGVEGKIELKYSATRPAREGTSVFANGGLRDAQIVWIYNRVKHGGRVWILPQIGPRLFLLRGSYCRGFNEMTHHEIDKAAEWSSVKKQITGDEWLTLIHTLEEKT